MLSHAFLNASTEDVAVTSLGKVPVCVSVCVCVFLLKLLFEYLPGAEKKKKKKELKTSANCLEGNQNITYSLQIIIKRPSAHFHSINTALA